MQCDPCPSSSRMIILSDARANPTLRPNLVFSRGVRFSGGLLRFRQNGRLVSEESSVFPTFSPHLRFFREKIGPVFFRTKGQEFFLSEVRDRKSLNKKIAAGNILPTKICVSLFLHHKNTRQGRRKQQTIWESSKTNIFTPNFFRSRKKNTRFGLTIGSLNR